MSSILSMFRPRLRPYFIFAFLSLVIGLHEPLPAAQTIGIYAHCMWDLNPWDPDSLKTGVHGSEEAIIYLSEELAQLGYQVNVYANPPEDSKYTAKEANPRYQHFMFGMLGKVDIAIAWRNPFSGLLKGRGQKLYLWPHDTHHQPISDAYLAGFQDVLWLSDWQRQQWCLVNPVLNKHTHIFGNGINPAQFPPILARENPYACIYGSSYDRGLELLLDIWPSVKKEFPRATLDIYYGYTIAEPEPIRKKIEQLADLDVREHGMVGHVELNCAYAKAAFWTYPCTSLETFCITALRAQMCGAVPVIIEGSALKETVRHGYKCQQPADYLATLTKAMREADKITLADRQQMGEFILQEYTWTKVAQKWHALFQQNTTP